MSWNGQRVGIDRMWEGERVAIDRMWEGERVGIDRRKGVVGRESGRVGWEGGVGIDRVGRGIEWKSRVGEGETEELGGGESGDRVEEWGGRG